MNPLPPGEPWATAARVWLNLMLIPNVVLGLLIAYYAMKSDHLRDCHPRARHAARVIRICIVLLVVTGAVSATIAAADVYDMCKDPNYINTWWWYAWGCWMN